MSLIVTPDETKSLDNDNLEDVLADAANELRSIGMFALAAGVERARRQFVPPGVIEEVANAIA